MEPEPGWGEGKGLTAWHVQSPILSLFHTDTWSIRNFHFLVNYFHLDDYLFGRPLNFCYCGPVTVPFHFPNEVPQSPAWGVEWSIYEPGGCQGPQGQRREENGDLRSRDTRCSNLPICFVTVQPCLHLAPEFLNPRLWIQLFKVVSITEGLRRGLTSHADFQLIFCAAPPGTPLVTPL